VDNSPVIPSSIEDQDPESPTGSPGTENQAPHAPQDGPSVVVDQPPPPEAGRAPRAKRGAEASQNGARRQTPEQMLRDMAYQRGVAFDDLVALAGGPPPWRHTVVTKIRRFLETMPKLAEAEIDLRIRARRTAAAGAARDGPQPLGDILRSALPPEATP